MTAGTRFALLTTEMQPRLDKKTGKEPTGEVTSKWRRVRPLMNEILQEKGLMEVAEKKV